MLLHVQSSKCPPRISDTPNLNHICNFKGIRREEFLAFQLCGSDRSPKGGGKDADQHEYQSDCCVPGGRGQEIVKNHRLKAFPVLKTAEVKSGKRENHSPMEYSRRFDVEIFSIFLESLSNAAL